ncbi:MAG: glycosyltransferase family 4 protein [Treponema sp.]|nr:glycosyltransferase family 4 protein [Treponema sp.]
MKKKTIYLVSKFGFENIGGVERVNYYLYEILSRRYTVKVVSRRKKPFCHGDWLFQSLYMSLQLFFRRNKIVIGTSWHSFLYPCDFSIHHGTTAGVIASKCEEDSLYKRRISKMEQISAKIAKMNIAVSENCRQEMISFYGIRPEKIMVLNNFVNDSVFFPLENAVGEREKAVASGNIRIIFSGRLGERKGIEKLIALSNLIEKKDGFELLIATVSGENNGFFAGNKKTIIKTGVPFSQMNEFYNSGDVFYFPSHYEGFSMATLEALCAGLPVVGSKYAVMPELRSYDFVAVTDSSDMEELLSVITKIVVNNTSKKALIHGIIKDDFGRSQYEKKLFDLIG